MYGLHFLQGKVTKAYASMHVLSKMNYQLRIFIHLLTILVGTSGVLPIGFGLSATTLCITFQPQSVAH